MIKQHRFFFRAKTSILHCRVGSVAGAGWIFCKESQYSHTLQSPNSGSLLTAEKATGTCCGFLLPPCFHNHIFSSQCLLESRFVLWPFGTQKSSSSQAVRLYPTRGSHFWVRTSSYELHPSAHDEGTSQWNTREDHLAETKPTVGFTTHRSMRIWMEGSPKTSDSITMQNMGWHKVLPFLPPPLVETNLAYTTQVRQRFGCSSHFPSPGSHPN